MERIQPAGCYREQSLVDGGTLYHDSALLPKAITSFEAALNPSVWRNHFKPFACAIVHPYSHEVILVRDHLGVEPLYYCHYQGKHLIFGDSLPAILKYLPETPPFFDSQIATLFSEHKCYSDETFYQGIYRVEPGHLMHFKSDGSVVKKAFWQLEQHGPTLHYENDQDYLDHFSMLMTESILNATENEHNIAAEFSAGLDSSAVYCAAASINLRPKLFMHVEDHNATCEKPYNSSYEKMFIDHYQLTDIQRIGSDDFDPIQVFRQFASWFAGPAPYLFSMFAYNVHRAVAAGGHPILLSGFGGDQGVSGAVPLSYFIPDLIHQGEFRQAWLELMMKQSKTKNPFQQVKRSMQYLQYMHPGFHGVAQLIKSLKLGVKNSLRSPTESLFRNGHAYQKKYYHSVREAEWLFLQGSYSHEVRMRIEYSSIVSKKMGFQYRYPLLYPKLLEFILSIPSSQKRREGRGRYLIQQYLSQFLPGEAFRTYRKDGGLGIVPSTFGLYKQQFEQGSYLQEFKDLPYPHLIKHKESQIKLRNCIKGFMIKAHATSE